MARNKNNLDDLIQEIQKENPSVRKAIEKNPEYHRLLREELDSLAQKYEGPVKWARAIDTWDKWASRAALAVEVLVPGAGLVAKLEEIPELVPKAIYASYYVSKTGDTNAIPYWAAIEAASLTHYVGNLIDMGDHYVERAKKTWKREATRNFRQRLRFKDRSISQKRAA